MPDEQKVKGRNLLNSPKVWFAYGLFFVFKLCPFSNCLWLFCLSPYPAVLFRVKRPSVTYITLHFWCLMWLCLLRVNRKGDLNEFPVSKERGSPDDAPPISLHPPWTSPTSGSHTLLVDSCGSAWEHCPALGLSLAMFRDAGNTGADQQCWEPVLQEPPSTNEEGK